MDQNHVNRLAEQFKQTFSEDDLNDLGKEIRFCVREREITPFRLTMGLIEAFANSRVETIADIHRAFNALIDANVQYKPFHNQLVKKQFPVFMRSVCGLLLEQLACRALHFDESNPFSVFESIFLQDGTSFSVKPTLREDFPGRFRTISPAAVELHVCLDLLSEQAQRIVLSPDTDSEAQYLPDPNELAGTLVMGDRGYFKKAYLAQVDANQGHFIIKGKSSINPMVLLALTEDGLEKSRWRNKPLADIKSMLSKRQRLDMNIRWFINGKAFDCRLIVSWNPQTKAYQYLVTNLPSEQFSIDHVVDAYSLRWQIELLFKEWKSYANLHTFNTGKPTIAEGLIWAPLCAAILKRYCAHITQYVAKLPISTRKVAMCIRYVLFDLVRALIHCHRNLKNAIKRMLDYLSNNALRAHPKRDQISGRSKIGLKPVYEGA